MGEHRPAVALVGMHGGDVFGDAARRALAGADVIVGAPRHLEEMSVPDGVRVEALGSDLVPHLEQIRTWRDSGRRVCIVVSGDPGFFGLARLAASRIGREALEIHPAPSSVSMAFARAGLHWDDALVLSAHGRPLAPAVEAVRRHPKVAVLCSPESTPEVVGRAVRDAGPLDRRVVVASRLGARAESVWSGDLPGLAEGRFDPLSVVVFAAPDPDKGTGLAWGLPESGFEHRAGMITKAEVRAVALGKLSLPAAGVLWDIGAGSGSVTAECNRLAPGLDIYAVERTAADVPALRRNLAGRAVTVLEGEAPAVLGGLPDPDRVFLGGGGAPVLEECLRRLRPGGVVVANFASPERAAAAYRRLGQMVQISVNRAAPLGPDGAMRLAAENPVFVCWGPA